MTIYKKETFPAPACPGGYPEYQLEEIFDEETMARFTKWMYGQTMMLCDGRSYNHSTKQYEDNECTGNAHGGVAYKYDVHRFLGFLGKHHQELWD